MLITNALVALPASTNKSFYFHPSRHQFYLNIRDDIVEGRLQAPLTMTQGQIAHAAAVLAQAELGDLPDNVSFKNPSPRWVT